MNEDEIRQKPVPSTSTIPATDADRRQNTNLAPQGEMHPGTGSHSDKFTPEGDQEPHPNIPPSATDPA